MNNTKKLIYKIIKELDKMIYRFDTYNKNDNIEKHISYQINNYNYTVEFYRFLEKSLFPYLQNIISKKYNNELAWRITKKGITLYVSKLKENNGKFLGIDLNANKNLHYEYFNEDFLYKSINYKISNFEKSKAIVNNSYQNKIEYIDDSDLLSEEEHNFISNIKDKIARVCWNSNGWRFPSGPIGKSSYRDSFENKYGFGFEEWLFDKRKIIDGFHYAFLQPLNIKTNKHVGKNYNISLITIHNNGGIYYIGTIKNAKCISQDESKNIYDIYKKNGWLKEMIKEIKNVNGKSSVFKDIDPNIFVNVKFKAYNLKKMDELEKISKEDENITSKRYILLPQKSEFIIEKEDESNKEDNYRDTSKRKRVYKGECEYEPYHEIMQNKIYDLLKSEYNYEEVYIEKDRVDIKALTCSGKWHFFEIKTDSPKLSIRQALGQIMEYTFFPNDNRANKMIIVSDTPPNKEVKTYLELIRKEFNLPIYYNYFDFQKELLFGDY